MRNVVSKIAGQAVPTARPWVRPLCTGGVIA
jgi:hypothetical protein